MRKITISFFYIYNLFWTISYFSRYRQPLVGPLFCQSPLYYTPRRQGPPLDFRHPFPSSSSSSLISRLLLEILMPWDGLLARKYTRSEPFPFFDTDVPSKKLIEYLLTLQVKPSNYEHTLGSSDIRYSSFSYFFFIFNIFNETVGIKALLIFYFKYASFTLNFINTSSF